MPAAREKGSITPRGTLQYRVLCVLKVELPQSHTASVVDEPDLVDVARLPGRLRFTVQNCVRLYFMRGATQ